MSCDGHRSENTLIKMFTRSCVRTMYLWKSINEIPRRSNHLRSQICKASLQQRCFSLSAAVNVGRTKNTKKKLIKPVVFSSKGAAEVIGIRHNMSVSELAAAMNRSEDHVFECMLYINNTEKYDSPDSEIDSLEVIKEILKKSGFKFRMEEVKIKKEKESKEATRRPPADAKHLKKRPPVVTIMGHVDHGKTTLLDTLQKSRIVDQEFGGITQHIGAFKVKLDTGEEITFLDTPGHAAFSNMRSRGAHATDIVVLVVAADDGVMKQTVESIKMAQDAEVPIIVALNKMDKPDVNPDTAKRGLLQHGLQLEEYGGETQVIPISALKGTNIKELQEAILALAEVLEIKGDPTGLAEGVVIESSTHPGRGKLATVLIQRGVLRKGQIITAGTSWGKVRNMFDDQGEIVKEAGPGRAVEVIGWRELPSAGDEIIEVENEKRAREVISWRVSEEMEKKALKDAAIVHQKVAEHDKEYHERRQAFLDRGIRRASIYRRDRAKEIPSASQGPVLHILVKGDVDGTVEAILDVLDSYYSDQCRLDLVSYGVGDLSQHDIELAESFDAIIYAFNVNMPTSLRTAIPKNIQVKHHNIIYKMFNDLKGELNKRLEPVEQEEVLGEANVLQLFTVTDGKKKVPVAGCRCTSGSLVKKQKFKLLRNEEIIYDGSLSSMRHLKNEVETIKTDVECGLSLEDHEIVPQPGDIIQCYKMVKIEQEIDWDLEF